jgi:tRNA(fMet)-specific endonuclease VapC
VSRLIFDTTFLIDAERAGDDLDDVIADDDDVAVAAVTLAELRVGALLASGRRRERRIAFVDEVGATVPVVSYDAAVAEEHALLLVEVRRQGRPRGAHDLIIAATAKASRRTVMTSDAGAFEDLPGVDVRPHR